MSFIRTVLHIARLAGQSLAYAVASRQPTLLVVLLVVPVLLLVALIAGWVSPFVVYPFI